MGSLGGGSASIADEAFFLTSDLPLQRGGGTRGGQGPQIFKISAAAGAHRRSADWVSPVSRTQAAQVCEPIKSKSVKRQLLRVDHFGS